MGWLDDSATGKVFTAYGNAQQSTAQKKVGDASLLLDGTGDYLDTPTHADFAINAGEFTVDVWVRRGAIGSRQIICGQATNAGGNWPFLLEFQADNTVRGGIQKSDLSATYLAISTGTITDTTTWHHIELCRDNTGTDTIRLFIDGTADGTAACNAVTAYTNSTNKFSIGRVGEYDGLYVNGYIDEFRFGNGICRHTANFTPPTAPYTPDSYDKVLMHYDLFPAGYQSIMHNQFAGLLAQ